MGCHNLHSTWQRVIVGLTDNTMLVVTSYHFPVISCSNDTAVVCVWMWRRIVRWRWTIDVELVIQHFTVIWTNTHTHTRLTALFPGLPRWAGTRKVKPIWILLKQETVSGSGISWAICKSAPRSRQITTPAPTTQFFTGRMPFVPPNQQRQSTEGNTNTSLYCKQLVYGCYLKSERPGVEAATVESRVQRPIHYITITRNTILQY